MIKNGNTNQPEEVSCLLLAKSRKLAIMNTVTGCLHSLQTTLKGQGRVWWGETEEYKGNEVGQELRKVEAE